MLHNLRLPSSDGYFYLGVDSRAVSEGNALADVNVEGCTLFVASWLALLSDSPITSSARPRRAYKHFYKRLTMDLKSTVLSFSELAHELSSYCTMMGPESPSGDWIDGMRETPVFREYINFYSSGDPVVFRYLYNFLSFGKKMEYEDPEFNKAAFRGWQDVERRLSGLQLDGCHVKNVRLVLSLLPPLNDYPFWPKHGPGNVAEPVGRSPIDKHNCVRYDRLLDRAFFTGHFASYGLAKEAGFSPDASLPDPSAWIITRESVRLPSRLRFAKKNMKVARSVCSEPAPLMYFQQGVFSMMNDATRDSPFRKFIYLEDQSRNQRLAEFGSFTASIDTLDLSSASDSLSVELVKKVFPTSWKYYMLATRNPLVQTDEGVIAVKKFAPMGSAVCFPTQCLIFSAICVYAHCLHTRNWHVSERPVEITMGEIFDVLWRISDQPLPYQKMTLRYQPLGVYGDDICCDHRVTDIVKALLVHFGFEVNERKSFTGSQSFRESCGKYYLLGEDVTPLFYRIKDVRGTMRAGHIYSQVSLINGCLMMGYRTLRSFLIYSLIKWRRSKKFDRFAVPFVYYESDQFGIKTFSWKRDNSHLRSRYNTNYQRREYRVLSILPGEPTESTSAHEAYLRIRWWASHRGSTVDSKRVSAHEVSGDSRLGWRWTPVD